MKAWLSTVEHTAIGKRFIVTAFFMFALAGLLALVMRTQLGLPSAGLVGPDLYNQIFTVHGTTMMFLFAVPVFQGLGLYFVPLMVGAKDLVFPRLAAFSYWVYLGACVLLWGGFLWNTGPDAGWFAYVPLSGPEFSPGKRVDVWAQTISMTETSTIGTACALIGTILKGRAPGMSLDRMPIFVWAMLVTSFMILIAMPAVMVASTQLALDRLLGMHFYNPAEGGDTLLWQHLFWFFAHPEVYIIFLPALGIVSHVIVASARRKMFGYLPIVLANVATALLAFGLWVHHMFAAGLPQIGESFFTAASMLIAIPTGTQIFCWIATLWTGRPTITAPLLFVMGFVFIFVIGGLSGIMLASVPLDLQVHDTFFVVAHLHYVLIGGAVFPLLGGIHFWLPKISGRMPSERLGRVAFGLAFVGFNLTFFPMHQLGLAGMPRRVYTYIETSWSLGNLLATIGAGVLGLGMLAFLVNVVWSIRHGAVAGADPWGSDSLEWSVSSPPPPKCERETPTVHSRHPLWERGGLGKVTGLGPDESLVTTLVDALPDHREESPGATLAPLVAGLATALAFTAAMISLAPFFLCLGVVGVALVAWSWPRHPKPEHLAEEQP